MIECQTWDKFSRHFKNTVKTSAELAREFGHTQIEPGHLLCGLLSERGSVAGEFLLSQKLTTENSRIILQTSANCVLNDIQKLPDFSNASKRIIEQAVKIAYINKHKYIGTEHLLASLCESTDSTVEKIFTQANLPKPQLIKQTIVILKTTSKLPEVTENFKASEKQILDEEEKINESILDFFGRNLCDKKIQEKIDPVIGREKEIDRLIEILSRRTKNNPLLLGDPGVGKTAIIEGLAKKILEGAVPDVLADKKIYAIDLASIVAGTTYRGEFEARLKEIIWEVESRSDVILFIDEIHQISGAGSASGSMDAANILKPSLARGQVQVIGATTFTDYRKSIENDPALARRFQTIIVEEPTSNTAKNILIGIKKYLEEFHQVIITDEAIEAAVRLSQKYLPEKFLPDKAIDLIDEASAGIRARRTPTKSELAVKAIAKDVKDLENDLFELISSDNFENALSARERIDNIKAQVEKLKSKVEKEKSVRRTEITPRHIAEIIAKTTGIPADDLIRPEIASVLELKRNLASEIIGQQPALDTISLFLKRAKAGLASNNRPLASFLFVGPSGVGKTHTAKLLAKKFFGDEKALLKIDMSEYGEKFNVSKLIGSPAGYVGYKESGQLTEKIKRRPYSLILLDEVEKAHPDVFDLLLQVLEDGYLTDASGGKISFTNTIIVMTSNLGSKYFNGSSDIGFGNNIKLATDNKVLGEAEKWFKPEFINRLDSIICFNDLSADHLEQIANLELNKLVEKLKEEKKLTLKYSSDLAKIIAKVNGEEKSLTNNRGARGIKTSIRNLLETPLADKLLRDNPSAGSTWRVIVKNGIITLS